MTHTLLLVLTGMMAGMVNSIAGGGIFLVLPALIMAGLTGKEANASGSFAVWSGQAVSLYENRQLLPKKSILVKQLIGIGLIGSIIGGLLLVYTPNVDFEHALPYLNIAATLIFVLGPWLKKKRRQRTLPWWVFPLFCLAIGVYGGYFGGGLGMLMLAVLSMTQLRDVRQQNAVKLLAATVINLTSLIVVVFANLIVWRAALPAAAGAFTGGYIGARFSKKVSDTNIRYIVITIGTLTSVYLFMKFY